MCQRGSDGGCRWGVHVEGVWAAEPSAGRGWVRDEGAGICALPQPEPQPDRSLGWFELPVYLKSMPSTTPRRLAAT